jgi:hypothetical protein
MSATLDLPEAIAAMKHRPREDAYGPSPIDSSTRGTQQIDLWMGAMCIRADGPSIAQRA